MQYNMATEVNQNYFAWPQEESSVQDSSQGTPQVFDHGSISFGRFELESLAWEKWSVFTNDRRHEEFVKFNGLVAKKKAYFEEYFKRIRELKALQQQNQQTELNLEYSGDGSDSSQTEEDESAAEHGSPAGSGTHIVDSMERTAAETTSEHELECYKDHEYESLNYETCASTRSSPVGGSLLIGQEISETASGDNCSGRMDMLQQNANCSQDDLGKPHETMMTPKRTIEKHPRISQASKIIPKTVKMTSSNIPDHTIVNKGPDSSKPSVINQKAKPENIQSLRRAKAAINVVGITGRSKLMAKEAPGVIAVRRPSPAASQWPSTRERRPVTRYGSQKPAEIATTCRPSTAERHPATSGLAPKQANIVAPHRPSTADRRPITKESAPNHANIATPHRPSTAHRRYSQKAITQNLVKSSKLEIRSYVKERIEHQVDGIQKSSFVSFTARKMLTSNVRANRVLENIRKPNKEGIQKTVRSRVSESKNITPLQTGRRAPNPPPPPLPPRQPSQVANKPNPNNLSVGGRKPKASAPHWH